MMNNQLVMKLCLVGVLLIGTVSAGIVNKNDNVAVTSDYPPSRQEIEKNKKSTEGESSFPPFDKTDVSISDENKAGLKRKTGERLAAVKFTAPTSVKSARDEYVKGLRDSYYVNFGGRYNTIAFNLHNAHSYHVYGLVHKSDHRYGLTRYRVLVFRNGWFNNRGDGGYINWAFRGKWVRYDGFVQFH